MEAWSHFLETFFKWEVIERYFPEYNRLMQKT